jgi:DNA-binding transcriptional ArsR family regulator
VAAKRARIERRVWDAGSRSFAATGETMEGDVATLEQLADKLSGAGGRYLKGPVPWPWIVAAAALPGKALIVGLCLWRLAGATKNRTVVLGNVDLAPFGIGRAAKSRALAALEDAGLVTVTRQPNRFPVVTLPASPAPSRRGRRMNSAALGKSIR